jgi:hypothetical protein
MTVVRIAVHSLIRTAVLALALIAYDWVYDLIVPPPPDADIGKGLLAFLLLAGIAFMWGLYDGLRTSPVVWAFAWVLSGVALSVGWEAWLADGSPDQMQVGSIVFIAQLVLVPGIFGAGLTWATGGRRRETLPAG